MPRYNYTDPAAATNAFARQVQLGANMRAGDQAEELNALEIGRQRKAAEPQYDPDAFQKVGGIAAQIASLPPEQRRPAFKTAILQNGALFDTMGLPHQEALAKIDASDDTALEQTLAALAQHAPKAAPMSVAAGTSLVRGDGKGGFETAYTAPKETPDADPYAKIDVKDYTAASVARFEKTKNRSDLVPRDVPKPDDGQNFRNAAELRKEFNNQSTVFRGVGDSFQRIQDSASDPSAAGDLSLIFNFMKVLDPGSTVREGEFATAAAAGSVPARIWAQYNKLLSGERLAPEQRADFLKRATTLYKGQEERFKTNVLDRYTGLAKRYGFAPEEIIGPINATVPQNAAPPGNGGGGAAPQQAPPAALEFLRQHPDQAPAFQAKYGYLP